MVIKTTFTFTINRHRIRLLIVGKALVMAQTLRRYDNATQLYNVACEE